MERIYVTVRARPLPQEDANCSPWRISGNSISVPNSSSKFEFDRVFGEDCKTAEVYEARTRDIVSAAVRGFNGTVFAYGQTNSGKTHTMRGSATEPGVIPLAVHELFETIQEDVDREFLLRMSYMEIYNEEINDLLAPEHRKLQIHESLERGIYVAGLREEIVASPQQVLDLMQFGESHRHIGETNMNLYSSRSHTIFRMIVESRDRNEAEDIGNSCDAVRVSVLNLVDLAGSERAAKTGAEGVRLKEGSHINKSLMTLGTVIKKLSEGAESQGSHVPYRDSKLTRILQPSLGGNANTAIICNITLAQIHADETKSSLQFASRALRVTNCARVNEILTDAALLKRQKKEIEELRAKLQGSHSEHLEEEILNLRNTLLQSELERERITLELEEEKRAQAEREKVLQEQAKKIKNLSSMVLYSNMDENREQYKKGKRRDTWCPGNLSRENLQELHEELQNARDEAKISFHCQLNLDSCVELSTEVENIIFEVQSSKEVLESVTSFEHEVFQSLSAISNVFVDIRALLHQISKEHKLVINDQEKLHLCMRQKITELENEKLVLYNQSVDFQKQMDDLRLNAQSLEGSLKSLSDQQNMEEGELRSYIQILENEISCLSSSSLAKEKESVRRDLEKVKIKLKETESKLKNASQEKTKLEGEKAYAEKEIKRLQGERTLLERDICKRESLAGRRRDSVIDKSSKGFDPKKAKGPGVLFEQTMQEDYRKLEVLAFEMETHIASLEDALAAASKEKEEVIYRNEGLALELEVMSEKLNVSNSELKLLQEDISRLRLRLEESKSEQEKMESSIKSLVEEKELLAMNLTDSLLEMEEEKAIWSAKEKASVETIELKVKLDNEEIKMLTTGMSEVKNELESCKAECKVLRERLTCAEENEKLDRKSSVEKSLEIDRLKNEQKMADGEGREAQDMLKSNVQTLSFQLHQSQEEADILRKELSFLSEERENLLAQVREFDKGTEQSNDIQNLQNQLFIMTNERDKLMFQIGDLQSHVAEIEVMKKNCDNMLVEAQIQVEEQVRRISRLEVKMHNDEVNNNKEKAKLRMRLRGTQASLDAHRYRYKEAINESVLMNRKFEEASRNLKDQLASYGIEVLNLKKQLASVKGLKGTE
ncbi:centromere-associated protein E isoform X1 [Tripterygium wilfordii]|uniref:Centromere-associated protein E isoform X1 n=1 Tax=Tripterygium wilfordii TaxID=458696 RepID=A0A7J7DPC8_TRIWF|nr:centromere-associated protein E isoform X1 [Tripterygium wilfordii]